MTKHISDKFISLRFYSNKFPVDEFLFFEQELRRSKNGSIITKYVASDAPYHLNRYDVNIFEINNSPVIQQVSEKSGKTEIIMKFSKENLEGIKFIKKFYENYETKSYESGLRKKKSF